MSMTCREVIENSEKILKCIEDPMPTGEIISTIGIAVLVVVLTAICVWFVSRNS